MLKLLAAILASFFSFPLAGLSGQDETASLIEANANPPNDFTDTQGQTVDDYFSPYAEAYLKSQEILPKRILNALFKDNLPEKSKGIERYISSYRYLSGNWTYFKSHSVVVYEALNVRNSATDKRILLLLYNTLTPQSEQPQEQGWRLAVMDSRQGTLLIREFAGVGPR
jgi:hypothetical protein